MKRQYIKLMVQESDETGEMFGERIEARLALIAKEGQEIIGSLNIQFTSSQNGRQTANITFEAEPKDLGKVWKEAEEQNLYWEEIGQRCTVNTYNFWPDLKQKLQREFKITKL